MYIVTLIILAEVLMWVCIGLVIFARYKLENKPLSIFFFLLMIVVNIVLLILTSLDLKNGGDATFAHGLAAIYIGISIAFGRSMIRYADNLYKEYILKYWVQKEKPTEKQKVMTTAQHLLAYVIGASLLYAMIEYVNDASQTKILISFIKIWTIVMAIDLGITLVGLINRIKK